MSTLAGPSPQSPPSPPLLSQTLLPKVKLSLVLRLDFLLYQFLGLPLEEYADSTLTTLQLPPKIITPFLLMVLASLVTPRNSPAALDRYYAKMKTPVQPDHEADAAEVEKSYQDPHRFDHRRLLPGTGLEFQKPTIMDVLGFVVSLAACFGIIGLAVLMTRIGG